LEIALSRLGALAEQQEDAGGMLRKHLRLRRREDFERLRRSGLVRTQALMTLSMLPNALSHNRYGFVVSRQLGGAAARNRVKRQLREAVRLIHPSLRSGYDIVIIARRALLGQPFTVIVRTLEELSRQSGLMQEEAR
jgi:ribonuclease P protein component